jgi:AcrR family transcriptional regulator
MAEPADRLPPDATVASEEEGACTHACGKPVTRGEARRLAMMEAGAKLFLERGFEGTSVSDIVRQSGGSLATLYSWFGSKEGLFEAIVKEVCARMVAPLDAPDFEALPLDEALRVFGEQFLSVVLCPEQLSWHRMCVAEGPRLPPELRDAIIRSGPGRLRERLAGYLTTQVEAGRLRMEDPMAAAVHFVSLVTSEVHFAAALGGPVESCPGDIQQRVRSAVDVFLYGYAVSSDETKRPTSRISTRRGERPTTSRS